MPMPINNASKKITAPTMGAPVAAPTAPVGAPTIGAPVAPVVKTSAPKINTDELRQQGMPAVEAKIKEDANYLNKLGANSNKVELIRLLGDGRTRQPRVIKGRQQVESMPVIGFVFKAHADIEVPQLSSARFSPTELWSAEDETTITVKAGEEFILTRAELLLFAIREDINCSFMFNGKPDGAKVVFKAVSAAADALPMPTIQTARTEQCAKETIEDITEVKTEMKTKVDSTGKTVEEPVEVRTCKAKYLPKFKDIFVRKTGLSRPKSATATGNSAEDIKKGNAALCETIRKMYANKIKAKTAQIKAN